MAMSKEELLAALGTGSHAEAIESWVPRAAAMLLSLTVHHPDSFEENPEMVLDLLRQITAKMPAVVLMAAVSGLLQLEKIAKTPGVTPELLEEVEGSFEDFNKDQ